MNLVVSIPPVQPMLAETRSELPPARAPPGGLAFEQKSDGYRAVLLAQPGGRVHLRSGNGTDLQPRVPGDRRCRPGPARAAGPGRRTRRRRGGPPGLRLVPAAGPPSQRRRTTGRQGNTRALDSVRRPRHRGRPALLAVHDAVDDGIAYRAELSVRVDDPVLSDDPILQHALQLPDSWWNDLAGTLEKVAAVDTGRVAVRQ